ncbi:MAG: peptidoglycan-binding protein, partial [Acutalibacter sp.]
ACYLYDLDGSAVTGDMFASTVMSYAGVTNVFQSLEGGSYDFDTLKIANPNVIFCAPGLKNEIKNDSRFSDFQAVQQDKIFELDTTLMEWQGRTIIDAAYEISANAFPELLESSSTLASDPTQQIDEEVSSALEQQANYQTLQQGDQGDSVVAIQERLEQLGYLTEAFDGHYGATTADCISRFQTANGIEATGIADPATQAALFAEGALREDGTPLPEEASAGSESSASESSSSETSSESSTSESSTGSESSASESSSSESSASA